jgi:hypothetical protein
MIHKVTKINKIDTIQSFDLLGILGVFEGEYYGGVAFRVVTTAVG